MGDSSEYHACIEITKGIADFCWISWFFHENSDIWGFSQIFLTRKNIFWNPSFGPMSISRNQKLSRYTKVVSSKSLQINIFWSREQKTYPRIHSSWSRCSRHGPCPATKVHNARFQNNTFVVPSGWVRRINGRHANKWLKWSAKIPKNIEYN